MSTSRTIVYTDLSADGIDLARHKLSRLGVSESTSADARALEVLRKLGGAVADLECSVGFLRVTSRFWDFPDRSDSISIEAVISNGGAKRIGGRLPLPRGATMMDVAHYTGTATWGDWLMSRCFQQLQIHNLGDLIDKTEQDLLSAKGTGPKTVERIKALLAQCGHELAKPEPSL